MLDEDLIQGRFGTVKITDIFEKRLHTRRERKGDGSWESITRELSFRRPGNFASGWARLFHFIVDMYGMSTASVFLSVGVAQYFQTDFSSLLMLLCFSAYFVLTEFFLQKTLPKIITRSIVVDEYGQRPSFVQVVLRTLIRFIPFEPFSHLSGNGGWHDRWTKTFVIRESELREIRQLIQDGKIYS